VKLISKILNISFISAFLLLSGCNVADKINENILDIKEEEPVVDSVKKEQEDNSSINDGNTTIIDGNSCKDGTYFDSENSKCVKNPICGDGTYLDSETKKCLPIGSSKNCGEGTHFDAQSNSCILDTTSGDESCKTNFHFEAGQCVPDKTQDILINEFNLTLPDYENRKSINIKIGKNDSKLITIRSNPKQNDITNKLKVFQFTNNSVVNLEPLFGGAPIVNQNYDFSIRVSSQDSAGKDEFQLTLNNSNGFTDSVYINVEVIDQITLSGVRNRIYPYTAVTDGVEQNITITAYNLLGNQLEFKIVNKDIINEEGKLLLIINGSSIFNQTKDGVNFKFSVRGLEDDKREVEIQVTDKVTGTVESIYITIESVRRNTQFYADLYECGEDYNSNSYEETSDENTDQSTSGVYSADRAIYLKSINNMDYDIGNKFSTVMLFHPTTGDEYSYDTYGKEYLTNVDTGKQIAILYYAKHLQGIQYFIKYYNEDKNSVVCEKRFFGFIDAVNQQPDILETLKVPNLSDKPSGPDGL